MQTILVTGANGQLGNELRSIAPNISNYRFVFTDVAELDITDREAVNRFVCEHTVNYILNCAAYTAVDKAEDDSQLCYRLNRDAVAILADALVQTDGTLIHISTDYVFDGTNHRPYVETDPVAPVSVYGQSKLEGELAALAYPKNIVIRTSWLYSSFGNNFVKTMIKLGQERQQLNVVFDQVGTPTYAADLASTMMQIVQFSHNNPGTTKGGVYHFSNEGACSWYDFTKTIHRLSGITSCQVNPIEGSQYPTQAARPHYSILNKKKIKETFGITIPHWVEALEKCLEQLNVKN